MPDFACNGRRFAADVGYLEATTGESLVWQEPSPIPSKKEQD